MLGAASKTVFWSWKMVCGDEVTGAPQREERMLTAPEKRGKQDLGKKGWNLRRIRVLRARQRPSSSLVNLSWEGAGLWCLTPEEAGGTQTQLSSFLCPAHLAFSEFPPSRESVHPCKGANFMSFEHGVAFIFSLVSECVSFVRSEGDIQICILWSRELFIRQLKLDGTVYSDFPKCLF